jgi:hypothetical protein
MQNFAVGEFSEPHDRHRRVNGEAHSSQNFARSGFSARHFEQRIAPLSLQPYRLYGCYTTLALYQERQTTHHRLARAEADTNGKSLEPKH